MTFHTQKSEPVNFVDRMTCTAAEYGGLDPPTGRALELI